MRRIPRNYTDIFEDFCADYQKVYGEDLLSITLYGSCARGEYVPGKSDINFLIVLSERGIAGLGKALPLVGPWQKRAVSTPLFLTVAYIESSLDSFPIEFLNMQSAYQVVFGIDVLRDLAVDSRHLRLQCERELKGKLLQLRERFLETGGAPRRVRQLISRSLPSFLAVFQAILQLNGSAAVIDRSRLLVEIGRLTGLQADFFLELMDIKNGTRKLAPDQAIVCMERYIEQIRSLTLAVDRMETPPAGQ
jgi:predicted nucleotidyltransferase